LIDAIESKRVVLKDLKDDQLPADLRAMTPEQREKRVKELMAERAEIRAKIVELSRQRDEYIAAEKKKLAAAGKGDSFDVEVGKVVSEEIGRKKK